MWLVFHFGVIVVAIGKVLWTEGLEKTSRAPSNDSVGCQRRGQLAGLTSQ